VAKKLKTSKVTAVARQRGESVQIATKTKKQGNNSPVKSKIKRLVRFLIIVNRFRDSFFFMESNPHRPGYH